MSSVPMSFRIGAGDNSELMNDPMGLGVRANFARVSSLIFMQNVNCIADLKLVSVESGVGWLNAYLEAADWQFINSQTRMEHPEYDLLPSEYFRRQIYGCFWFESDGLSAALDQLPDNITWETDYPQPTCMHPADYAETAFAGVPDETVEKLLWSTAVELYGIQ